MDNNKIGLKEAISIGIGGMVGGGIFAVLGLAVSLSKGGTPVAFLFAGLIALITAYSYARLSVAFPDHGGTVKFINQGFGRNVFSGGINNLLWVSYIIMLSLYAAAFGAYAPNLFPITKSATADFHIYASGIIVLATLVNYYSIKVVAAIESYAVGFKLVILILFVIIGLYGLRTSANLSQLSFHYWESPFRLLTGGMVIFVAYEGFELIANAAPDILNPVKNIPRAYYYAVIFVILLYVVIAIITVGSLPFGKIAAARDYVLAEAARPVLGQVGFVFITVAALISTFSAINATIYGGSRVNYEIAEDDQLPYALTGMLWNQPIGLLITVIFTLLICNVLNLENIADAGSIGFLLIFAAVNFLGFKFSGTIGTIKVIPFTGFVLCLLATAALIAQQYRTDTRGVLIAISIIAACFIMEFIYKRTRRGGQLKAGTINDESKSI
ncbi:MAG TPA: APC family permease [Mucilaginibacter sp.]|nr:APC family permease [Mucilaginibacter sp.]